MKTVYCACKTCNGSGILPIIETHARPISDLNLSVRSSKCMIRLKIETMGDLCRHTEEDLMNGHNNFGVTCLRECCEKLAAVGLKLKRKQKRKG